RWCCSVAPAPRREVSRRLATYRLQLRPGFGFAEAEAVLPYLRELRVSHVYCSPIFEAARGSTHGYDVVDPGVVREELGGERGFASFSAGLREHGLALVLDIVPNHMCVNDRGNWRWWDVLARGQTSAYAATFDIDWEQSPRVLVPILDGTLSEVIRRGKLQLARDAGERVVRYHDHMLPLSPETQATDEPLDELLELQHYRLADWREAPSHINYRRFFDINSLAGVRVEDADVFDDTQRLALELAGRGDIDGLRIDHIDGLRLPREYLHRVRERSGGDAWLLVEKILEREEHLPDVWPVDGTTGYEFAALAGGLFVDPRGCVRLEEFARELTGEMSPSESVVLESRRLASTGALRADVERLSRRLHRVCRDRDLAVQPTVAHCADAITALISAMPVYRTYSAADGADLSAADRAALGAAIDRARDQLQDDALGIVDLIAALFDGGASSAAEIDFVLRFQQVTAAVAAKGVEDTAFYRLVSLLSLNEVGDSPLHRGATPEAFHTHNARIAEQHPSTLLATSTHDTKRSEDVRMRLHVLSEFAELWCSRVREWDARAARHQRDGMPDGADRLILYQTLVGAHPLAQDRAAAYMEKASREAKRRTSWTEPNQAYDKAVQSFTRAVVNDAALMQDVALFAAPLDVLGRVNSLALTLLKLTSPGVPDIYQGCELWDLSLVDPDNRRHVDFELRGNLLRTRSDNALTAWRTDRGESKLALIAWTLALRRRREASFSPGAGYTPMHAEGARADHVVAFARGDDVAVIVPRLVGALAGWSTHYTPDWGSTRLNLPPGSWSEVLSGGEYSGGVAVTSLLESFPIALLERSE
ncbi:MAG TPA: malto-oligosyltrehalose synthase, partial [Candidatus Dormibacteraeota bacterium]|nr:malto-oligosyltrehalose synthase [Candidatus Dormibacteraeota bacterium]